MYPYVYGLYKGCILLDVLQTARLLSKAYFYLFVLAKNPTRNFLFIGSSSSYNQLVSVSAKSCGSFFINAKTQTGSITNWSILQHRRYLFYFLDFVFTYLNTNQVNIVNMLGQQDLYTILKNRYNNLKKELQGVRGMLSLPRYVIFIDPLYDYYLFLQCFLLKRKFIGLVDGSFNPEVFDIPIPANNSSLQSVKFILEVISTAIFRGKLTRLKKQFTRNYFLQFYFLFNTYSNLNFIDLLQWFFYLKKEKGKAS